MMQLIREQARANQPQIQDERVGPYIIKEPIAMGATGTVKLAIHAGSRAKCAVKIVSKTVTRRRKEARKEIKRLQSVQHDNIISLQHVEEDLNNLYIFTEYCEYGDLALYIQKRGTFDEMLAKKLFAQLVEAVDFCHHTMQICHHDIKLENCVITSDFRLRLIDFGFSVDLPTADSPLSSKSNNNSVTTTTSSRKNPIRIYDSSPAYSPLEILLRKPHDETVDIYSMGVCLYYMLVGNFPFCDAEKTSFEELCNNVRANRIDFPQGTVPPAAQDLILRMLARKKYRISIDEIRSHEWLRSDCSF